MSVMAKCEEQQGVSSFFIDITLMTILIRISEKSSNESASTPSDTATPGGAPYDHSEHEQVQGGYPGHMSSTGL